MTNFWKTDEYWKTLLKVIPAEVTAESFFAGVRVLSDGCDHFVWRVEEANKAYKTKRLSMLRNFQEVLGQVRLDPETEALLDAAFSELISAGLPPEKTLTKLALAGSLEWYDVRRYLTRKDLRRAMEQHELPDPRERDHARNFKEPRHDLFLTAFNVWASFKGQKFTEATISDPLEGPAQKFIRSATENALQVAGLSYPDGRTVADIIRKRKKAEKENA